MGHDQFDEDGEEIYINENPENRRPHIRKKIALSLTPFLREHIRIYVPIGLYISVAITSAPPALVNHFKSKKTKEKRTGEIRGVPISPHVTLAAYEIFMSIPKRWRSAFVRAAIENMPLKDSKRFRRLPMDFPSKPKKS